MRERAAVLFHAAHPIASGGAALPHGGVAEQLLQLRGGGAADSLPPDFVHAVLLGLLANSVAVVLGTSLSAEHPPPGCKPLQRAAACARSFCAMFFGFFAVFVLTGFVPMGYVPGASPLLPLFSPERWR